MSTEREALRTLEAEARQITAWLTDYHGLRDPRLIERSRAKARMLAEALGLLGVAMDKAAEPYVEPHVHCPTCRAWLCLDEDCGRTFDGYSIPGRRRHLTRRDHGGFLDESGVRHTPAVGMARCSGECPQPDQYWQPEPADPLIRERLRRAEAERRL